jgi:hypothetical protein
MCCPDLEVNLTVSLCTSVTSRGTEFDITSDLGLQSGTGTVCGTTFDLNVDENNRYLLGPNLNCSLYLGVCRS